MSARGWLQLGAIVLCLLRIEAAQAQNCQGVDAKAVEAFQAVSLPPEPKCAVRLKNGYPVPDPRCTPGAINTTVTLEIIKGRKFRTYCSLNTSAAERDRAYGWYKIVPPRRNAGQKQTCALDRLVPLELGGADSLANIWPLCGPPGTPLDQRYFKLKELVNAYLVAQVKSGAMELAAAQRAIATDWTQYIDAVQPRHHYHYFIHHRPQHKENEPVPQRVDLLLATTREISRRVQPVDGEELVPSDTRSEQLTFGDAVVLVPPTHIAGEVERPSFAEEFVYSKATLAKKYFILSSTRWLSQDDFVDEVKNAGPDEALIFVHGFNTSFQDGLYRLAQIVVDSHFSGIPILFSWPSKGEVQSYLYDENSAEFSITGFRQLITLLQEKTQVSTIHVIAHSMGNRIVLGPFREGMAGIAPKALGELVLAAPDVDKDVFQEEAANIVGFKGITLYASSKDWALKASEALAGYPRAGQVIGTPVALLPSIETIDASLLGADLLGLNHDTFAASAALCDIGRLLGGDSQVPNLRTSVITPVIQSTAGPPSYWKYAGADPKWSAKNGCAP